MEEFVTAYSSATLGVLISIVLPFLRAQLPKGPKERTMEKIKEELRPYLIIGAFSLISALLVIANIGEVLWNEALIAGYAWDSTLQKMGGPS